jgi:hypothetical protein
MGALPLHSITTFHTGVCGLHACIMPPPALAQVVRQPACMHTQERPSPQPGQGLLRAATLETGPTLQHTEVPSSHAADMVSGERCYELHACVGAGGSHA